MGDELNIILNIILVADYCFGLLIHDNALVHFMVSISDEYKHKQLVKTTFKLYACGVESGVLMNSEAGISVVCVVIKFRRTYVTGFEKTRLPHIQFYDFGDP